MTSSRTIAAALCGALASSIPSMIVASSLTEIAPHLDTTVRFLAWAITAPLLACAVAVATLGRVGDIIGHRRLFLVSMMLVCALSLLTTLTWDGPSFVVARVLTQVACIAAQPAAIAMLSSAVSGERRAQAFSAWGFAMSAGPATGLVIGGQLIDLIGWQSMFVLQAMFAGIAATLILGTDPVEANIGDRPHFDTFGAVWIGVCVLAVLIAFDRGFAEGWLAPTSLAFVAVALVAAALLVMVERRFTSPMIPSRFLRHRPFTSSIAALFFMHAIILGVVAMVPVLLRGEFGYSASRASLVVAFVPVGFGIASPIGARWALSRPRALVTGGGIAMFASAVLLAVSSGTGAPPLVMVSLLLLGLGAGLGRTVYALAVAASGGSDDVGIAVGLERMMGQIGGSLGVAMMLGVASNEGGRAGVVYAASIAACFAIGALVSGLSNRDTRAQATIPLPLAGRAVGTSAGEELA